MWSALAEPSITGPFYVSMKISAITALLGCLIGFLLAAAVIHGGLPKALRSAVMTFSGVASNFAGVPLSFAFIATLGRLGLITVVMREVFGFNIYATGFNLISFFRPVHGLSLFPDPADGAHHHARRWTG